MEGEQMARLAIGRRSFVCWLALVLVVGTSAAAGEQWHHLAIIEPVNQQNTQNQNFIGAQIRLDKQASSSTRPAASRLPGSSKIAEANGSSREISKQQLVARRWFDDTKARQSLDLAPGEQSHMIIQHDHQSQQHMRLKQQPIDHQPQQANFGDRSTLQQTAEHNNHCQKRGLFRVIKGAKSLLSDGFGSLERYAKSSGFMLGSSLIAATIPLVVFLFPSFSTNSLIGERRHLLDSLPSIGQSTNELVTNKFSLQSRVDSVMSWIERSVEHLPSFPRLHPQECVKRSICEAHNDPEKYGIVGFTLRILFPATSFNDTDASDNMEYKVINKYRHAAGFGLGKRLDNNGTTPGVCKEKYEDCLVSLLEVAKKMIDIFLKK